MRTSPHHAPDISEVLLRHRALLAPPVCPRLTSPAPYCAGAMEAVDDVPEISKRALIVSPGDERL